MQAERTAPWTVDSPLPDGETLGHDSSMLPLLVRHEIQVLRRAGHTQADVAARCGVSIREVRRIEAESPVSDTDDTALHLRRRVGRQSVADPWREFIVEQPHTVGGGCKPLQRGPPAQPSPMTTSSANREK